MIKTIYLAGGCFWGVEEYFRRTKGIMETLAGYANGVSNKTSYYDLYKTGHAEAVKIDYNDDIVTLKELLSIYATIIDPISVNKQGNDRGLQYRTGIYYLNADDKNIVDGFILELQKGFKQKIAIEVDMLKNFVPAEDVHQKYLLKNPTGYCHIKLPRL